MTELSDSITDQVLWNFASRQHTQPDRPSDVPSLQFKLMGSDEIWRASPEIWRLPPEQWRDEAIRTLALFEVFATAGCVSSRLDPRVYELARTLSKLPSHPRHSPPTWRFGLVRDYLARAPYDHETAKKCDEDYLYYVAELNALVEEFETSESGQLFLAWAHGISRVDSSWQVRRANQLARRAVTDQPSSGKSSDLVLFGATEYLKLLDNCYVRLIELRNTPEVMSACWAFHGNMFEDRRALFAALSLNLAIDTDRESSPALDEKDADTHAHYKRPLTDDIARLALNSTGKQLARGSEWAGDRNKAQWRDILDNLSFHW